MKPYSYLVDVFVYNGNINDATWQHHAYCSSAGEANSNDNSWVKRMYMFKQVHWSIKYFTFLFIFYQVHASIWLTTLYYYETYLPVCIQFNLCCSRSNGRTINHIIKKLCVHCILYEGSRKKTNCKIHLSMSGVLLCCFWWLYKWIK